MIYTIYRPEHFGIKALCENLEVTCGIKAIKFSARVNLPKDAKLIIWGGWSNAYSSQMYIFNKKRIAQAIWFASSSAQVEFSQIEYKYFKHILKLLRDKYVQYLFFCGGKTFEGLKDLHKNIVYFPPTLREITAEKKNLEGKNIDLFIPSHYRKNIFNQLLAVKNATERFDLHTNLGGEYQDFVRLLRIFAKNYPWQSDEEYYSMIASMSLGLQVTFCESFNYCVAEHFALGIPCMTASNIPFVTRNEKLKHYLVVKNIEDILELSGKIDFLLKEDKLRKEIGEECKKEIIRLSNENKTIVMNTLEKIIEEL